MRITNAGQASFPSAYTGYAAYASYDRRYWFKVPTGYDTEAGVLTIRHTPTKVGCQDPDPPGDFEMHSWGRFTIPACTPSWAHHLRPNRPFQAR